MTPHLAVDGQWVSLPTLWVVCPSCQGEGFSSRYLGSFSQDDMDQDPDFRDDYIAGEYDRACDECQTMGKVRTVDVDALSPKLKALWEQDVRDEREYQAVVRAERRMGA